MEVGVVGEVGLDGGTVVRAGAECQLPTGQPGRPEVTTHHVTRPCAVTAHAPRLGTRCAGRPARPTHTQISTIGFDFVGYCCIGFGLLGFGWLCWFFIFLVCSSMVNF